MPDFKAKMHKIRFPLGLRPRPRYTRGAYSVPPEPPPVFKGPTSKGRAGEEAGGEEEREAKGKGKVKGREGEVRGGKGRGRPRKIFWPRTAPDHRSL